MVKDGLASNSFRQVRDTVVSRRVGGRYHHLLPRRVLEKYVRRGSRFVTFRVEATNQNGDEVAQYDYTCIFDYDESRKDAPQETRETEASSPDTVRERYSWEASETWATNSRP